MTTTATAAVSTTSASASAAPPPLSRDAVYLAIDDACCTAPADCGWSFRRATPSTGRSSSCSSGTATTITTSNANSSGFNIHQQHQQHEDELLFGIVSTSLSTTNEHASEDFHSFLTTFYFAYSTWDGRVLYLDQMEHPHHNDDQNKRKKREEKSSMYQYQLTLRQILAQIACQCHCSRFTWQQHQQRKRDDDQIDVSYNNNNPTMVVVPAFLKGWLTLQWQCDDRSIHYSKNCTDVYDPSTTTIPVQKVIEDCLKTALSDPDHHKPSSFSLRLARMDDPNDLEAIGRLVQGLADFEKEPDAVHVTLDHYRIDGSAGPTTNNHPLFYCLLLETKSAAYSNNNDNDHTTCTTNNEATNSRSVYTCGIAFCYLGYTRTRGRHWYLEDLFLEQAYRGKGAGKYILQTLARVATQLGCSHLRWQALDWNEPALQFYHKLGARVVDGLETWRFAGDDLKRLASFTTASDISSTSSEEQSLLLPN